MEDDIVWSGTKDGNYSVKSGYHAIKSWEDLARTNNSGPSNTNDTVWTNLWHLNIPPKYIHLIWRILNNGLPVKTNLVKRGIKSDSLCPRCNRSPETVSHTFMDCDWSQRVWFASSLNINFTTSAYNNFTNWLHEKSTKGKPEEYGTSLINHLRYIDS